MKKSAIDVIASLALILMIPGLATSAAVDYTDRVAWETAVGTAPTLTDDYDDAVSDIDPVSGWIARAGYGISSVIRIDVAPFLMVGGAQMSCNGSPNVLDSGNMVVTFSSSGCWATIDNLAAHPGVVSDLEATWGGIKALYR